MAKRKRGMTEDKIERWKKEGRGSGEGENYKPWLTIQDVSSKGNAHRVPGIKIDRQHHLLSELELKYFHVVERSPIVADIYEQYPLLEREETLAIAKQLGIKPPTDPRTKYPIVMTTDFLLLVKISGGTVLQARTVKYVSELSDARVIEKLEIERRFWEIRGVDWGIVTERDISENFVANTELVRAHWWLDDWNLTVEEIAYVSAYLSNEILSHASKPLNKITTQGDKTLGHKPGTSLAVVYHMLATEQWRIDMQKTLDPSKPLQLL